MMPVMDGFEFVMEMRKLNASDAIPIVVGGSYCDATLFE